MSTKPGLYANIHAKRERIKAGSGEKMRRVGSKGAPTSKAFKQSARTAKRKGLSILPAQHCSNPPKERLLKARALGCWRAILTQASSMTALSFCQEAAYAALMTEPQTVYSYDRPRDRVQTP
jgi:hypothetical protein